MMTPLKELEDENRWLKKMYAEERLKADILKETIEKSGKAVSSPRDGAEGRFGEAHQHLTVLLDV